MNTENEYWSQLRTVITKLEIVNSSFGRFSIRLLQFAAVLNVPTFSSQLFFSVKLAYLSFLSPPSFFIQQCWALFTCNFCPCGFAFFVLFVCFLLETYILLNKLSFSQDLVYRCCLPNLQRLQFRKSLENFIAITLMQLRRSYHI